MIVTGASARRALILLVDDEAPVRELLAEHLEDAGYRVLATASGAAALALLATAETVDILITDLSMPGMDGLAVIRAAQERLPRLPAVLLTGYAGDGAALAVAGTVSGSFSLLRKPVSGVELIDRVRTLLAGAGKSLSNGARMHAASGSESG
jgi:CheY-like chemotaxis protein